MNNCSRCTANRILTGTVNIHGSEYAVTEAFKQQAIELSDALDLDEVQAATVLFDSQQTCDELDRPQLISAIFNFHQVRHYSLECLRLVLEKAADDQIPDVALTILDNTINLILLTEDGKPVSLSAYWQHCFEAMSDLERWSERIRERIQRANITEQAQSAQFTEIMEFQHTSVSQQHESLGAIAYRLCTRGQINVETTRWLLGRMKTADRYDSFLVHQLPPLLSSLSSLAGQDSACTITEAKPIQQLATSFKENDIWTMPSLQAAVSSVWLAEYAGRFSDRSVAPAQDINPATEAEACDVAFDEALKHGSLQFLLAVSHDVRRKDWYDLAKQGFHSFLIQDSPSLHIESYSVQEFLRDSLTECLQNLVEGLIENMPDSLRRLKFEEDEQRRQFQGLHQLRPSEFELHLERLLLLVSNAYDGYADEAAKFWSTTEGNLYGFLQWASIRQSTPRVAAFCEVLQALSPNEYGADMVHDFLLDESQTNPVRSRRNSPLSWGHIFRELEYYASSVRDKPTPQATGTFGQRTHPDLTVEPESSMMLECYLRLIAHIGSRSMTARQHLIKGPIDLLDNLMQLYASNIPSRLRACAFTALSGLLAGKDRSLRNLVWAKVDGWIYAQPMGSAPQPSRSMQAVPSSANAEKLTLDRISQAFEEPNAFVTLMQALIAPIQKEIPLRDSLPFPEDLGARYRMSGIEPYVDFVMGTVFATKSQTLSDALQLRIMRWSCLTFATTCLSDFNEDLIVLANRSRLNVESAIETSTLAVYARMHPFARTMEWLFNDQVIAGLFAAALQDTAEVNGAASDSPLVWSLMSALEVIDSVLAMQRTYFDIVRPVVKTQSNGRKPTVANSALASFEDAIATRLDLITTLGLYCGSGHADLATASLKLLKRLSESRKLVVPISGGPVRAAEKSRLIMAMERDHAAEGISRALANIMQFDPGEIDPRGQSPRFVIKSSILEFLASSLETVVNRPAVAHLLLGFACSAHSVYIDDKSLFGTEQSLFDSLAAFTSVFPEKDDLTYLPVFLNIRNKAVQVLRCLWRSPLSSSVVLTELRNPAYDYFFTQALRQEAIDSQTLWGGMTIREGSFWASDSALAYANFLQMRTAFFELAATELRSAHEARLYTLKGRLLSSLFGSTKMASGEQFSNATIYDLLDFVDLLENPLFMFPAQQLFTEDMFEACKDVSSGAVTYNIDGLRQIILLRQSEYLKQGPILADADRQKLHEEAYFVETWAIANNAKGAVARAQREAVKAWFNLATMILYVVDPQEGGRQSLVLQFLQLMLPKLERALQDDIEIAELLAGFALELMRNADFRSEHAQKRLAIDDALDRMFELFRACLTGIQSPESTSRLRQTCARACRIFIVNSCLHQQKLVRRVMQTLRSFGDRLMDTICDDAYGGDDENRVAALLLLEAAVFASNLGQSKYVLEAFNHRNFIQITVGLLGRIPLELQQSNPEGMRIRLRSRDNRTDAVTALSTTYASINAGIALLNRIAQSRQGGALVLNSGLFACIRESGIFSADPDIGLDFDDPSALSRFYKLMLAILHVTNAVVMSQSSENEQTIHQARAFLHEYRSSMMSIFKRNAGIGARGQEYSGVLNDLVDNYTALIVATDFMEVS